MNLADATVAELYNADQIIGKEPMSKGEGDFLRMENPYSLNSKGPQNISMFKQAGGSRRKRRATRRKRRRSTKRKSRRHH